MAKKRGVANPPYPETTIRGAEARRAARLGRNKGGGGSRARVSAGLRPPTVKRKVRSGD